MLGFVLVLGIGARTGVSFGIGIGIGVGFGDCFGHGVKPWYEYSY